MSLSLILFLISLICITFMIGQKLALIRNGQNIKIKYAHPFVPELQKIKNLSFRGVKKFGYILIFIILRFFIKSSNFIKTKSILLVIKIKNKLKKKKNPNTSEETERKEVSGYLKIISAYRQKIRNIKHIIKEEEGIE